jgi:TrpR-related protein YerC/YecD
MVKVSRVSINKQRLAQFYDDFWSAIALLETKQEARGFFFDLLTHTERKMLAKRLQVAIMLIEGYDYQKIKSYVRVTDQTIARINNWLNTGAIDLIKIIERLLQLKEKKLVKQIAGKEKFLAGDLLSPAIKDGLEIIARHLKKKAKIKSVLK